MIHYHGTPIGGSRQDAARFLIGRHALVPASYKNDLGIVSEVCKSFVFDNGAFTAWKQGAPIDIEKYYKWVDEWYKHPGFSWALIPDVIEGNESQNNLLINEWPCHLKNVGVPVWHLHESIERLVDLCNNWHTVAIGSSGEWASPGTSAWWQRVAIAMDAICDEQGRPKAKLHGLRMLDPQIFTKLPLSSADSTNAAVNCGSLDRYGMYLPPTASQRAAVIAERIEMHNSAPIWRPQPIQQDIFNNKI